MRLGTVTAIWRYPVKSMAGESIPRAALGELGLVGDRGWAFRDEQAGEIRGAKRLPKLMQCEARYMEEPSEGSIPVAEMRLPSGQRVRTNDPSAARTISELLGREVTLWARQPKSDLDHYRRSATVNIEDELRFMFARAEGEPQPDLSNIPAPLLQELIQYTSPLGTYFDAFPLTLLTTAMLSELGRRHASARFEPMRFRPNIVIDTGDAQGFVEFDWCGKSVRIGDATIDVVIPTVRCSMTTQATGDLPKDHTVLRTIVRESGQNCGVYSNVARSGYIAVGDAVELV